MPPVTLTIYGNLASKSNSRKLAMVAGKTRFIKSERALSWEKTAYYQIPPKVRQKLLGDLKMTVHVYYDSRRPDLDVSLLMDVLQKAEVYLNDRQIVEQHLYKHLDKDKPRCEIELIKIADSLPVSSDPDIS